MAGPIGQMRAVMDKLQLDDEQKDAMNMIIETLEMAFQNKPDGISEDDVMKSFTEAAEEAYKNHIDNSVSEEEKRTRTHVNMLESIHKQIRPHVYEINEEYYRRLAMLNSPVILMTIDEIYSDNNLIIITHLHVTRLLTNIFSCLEFSDVASYNMTFNIRKTLPPKEMYLPISILMKIYQAHDPSKDEANELEDEKIPDDILSAIDTWLMENEPSIKCSNKE